MIDPVVSLLARRAHWQYFSSVLFLPLRWLRVKFVTDTVPSSRLKSYYSGQWHSQKTQQWRRDFIEISLEISILENAICAFSKL